MGLLFTHPVPVAIGCLRLKSDGKIKHILVSGHSGMGSASDEHSPA
jgi:hypothetical protein